jgi:hypothetical protein
VLCFIPLVLKIGGAFRSGARKNYGNDPELPTDDFFLYLYLPYIIL